MLYFMYGSGEHPRHVANDVSFVINFRLIGGSEDIAIFKFWQFGLKMSILVGFGDTFLQMMSLIVLTLKGTVFG